jgi:hypothetical protein
VCQSSGLTISLLLHSAKIPVLQERSKHIDVRQHFLRDCVEEGTIIVGYTATAEQLVDLLTKAVGRTRFQELHDKIGIKATGDRVRD